MVPSVIVVGAGNRGASYADLVRSHGGRVVGVCEPDNVRRRRLGERHQVPEDRRWADWRDLPSRRVADAAVIATLDTAHVEPAVGLAEAGYHLLLEKPMASSLADAERIVAAATRADVLLAVCHVLRYTAYTALWRRLLAGTVLGDVLSVSHVEPVGWWHFAHSYVRGNWRRTDTSGPLLLTKCSHDIDWLGFLLDRDVDRVSSFGSLGHFGPGSRPPNAASRCVECPVESECPYAATRFYLSKVGLPEWEEWPLRVVSDDTSAQGIRHALATGPYGRCVYECDNDVVDHQVVNLEYAGGVTASFTVTAFTAAEHRRTRFFGSHGTAEGDGRRITVTDFRTGQVTTHDTGDEGGATAESGHGGGDSGLVAAFLTALRTGDRSHVLSGPQQSLRAHQVVSAAERARTTGQVVTLSTGVDDHPHTSRSHP